MVMVGRWGSSFLRSQNRDPSTTLRTGSPPHGPRPIRGDPGSRAPECDRAIHILLHAFRTGCIDGVQEVAKQPAGAKARVFADLFGTTKVVPCYKADFCNHF